MMIQFLLMVDDAAGVAVIDAQKMPARARPGLDAGQGKQKSHGFSSPNGFIPFLQSAARPRFRTDETLLESPAAACARKRRRRSRFAGAVQTGLRLAVGRAAPAKW
jgi:hypothetical protein